MNDKHICHTRTTISTLIVNESSEMRIGLESLLISLNGIGMVASVGSGKNALKYFDRLRPHLVLTDMSVKDMSGLQLAQAIEARFPNTKIIIRSTPNRPEIDPARNVERAHLAAVDAQLSRLIQGEVTALLHSMQSGRCTACQKQWPGTPPLVSTQAE